jgi:hypothetical protein
VHGTAGNFSIKSRLHLIKNGPAIGLIAQAKNREQHSLLEISQNVSHEVYNVAFVIGCQASSITSLGLSGWQIGRAIRLPPAKGASMSTTQGRSITLVKTLRCIIAANFVLLIWSAWRFQESLSNGLFIFIGAVAALIAYWAVTEWVRRASSYALQPAMSSGVKIGSLIGVLAIISHVVEVFSRLRAAVPAILGVGMWGVMFLGFGSASSMSYSRIRSMGPSLFASVWSALLSSSATVFFALAVGLSFMTRMQVVLAGEFAASGMRDSPAAVVRNLFDGAFMHLVAAPLLSVVVGAASLLILSLLRKTSRRTLLILGSLDVLLLGGAILSIHHASSLLRSSRPPFIMAGLLALCLSLASAYPLGVSIRRRPHSLFENSTLGKS